MNRSLPIILIAMVVYTAIVFMTDVREVGNAVASIRIYWVPLFLLLSILNYLLRFLKWHYFLGRVHVMIPWRESLGVFLAGFSMTVSPGKLGELLKCYLLKDSRGIAVSRTSPVVVAERLTDLISMIFIAVGSLLLVRHKSAMIAVLAGLLLVAVIMTLLLWRRAFCLLTDLLCRISHFRRRRESLADFGDHCRRVLDVRSLIVSVPLGMISWGAEALVLTLVSIAMGIQPALPVGIALLAHSAGTIAGAVSMIPGGLGLTELTIGAILTMSMSRPDAAAVTLIMRFATLWFAVLLGFIMLGMIKKKGTRGPRETITTD